MGRGARLAPRGSPKNQPWAGWHTARAHCAQRGGGGSRGCAVPRAQGVTAGGSTGVGGTHLLARPDPDHAERKDDDRVPVHHPRRHDEWQRERPDDEAAQGVQQAREAAQEVADAQDGVRGEVLEVEFE